MLGHIPPSAPDSYLRPTPGRNVEDDDADDDPGVAPFRELRPGGGPLAILGRVVRVDRRTVLRRSDGSPRTILSGLLSDGTAIVRFTWWQPPADPIAIGDLLRAAPVRIREYSGRPEITFGWKTRVRRVAARELPESRPEDLPLRHLAELAPGDEGFRVEVRLVEVAPSRVTVGFERREIHEGIVADASGALEFTAWTHLGLTAGAAVRIIGASVGTFRGRNRLAFDGRTRVDRIGGAALPEVECEEGAVRLGDLSPPVERREAVVIGRAVALRPPGGLVDRCPECGRTLTASACGTHGPVRGLPDLRLRLVLDDGTGTLFVDLDRTGVERLVGSPLEDLLRRNDPGAITSELFPPLLGRMFRACGPVGSDASGLSMRPIEFGPVRTRPPGGVSATPARCPGPEP